MRYTTTEALPVPVYRPVYRCNTGLLQTVFQGEVSLCMLFVDILIN